MWTKEDAQQILNVAKEYLINLDILLDKINKESDWAIKNKYFDQIIQEQQKVHKCFNDYSQRFSEDISPDFNIYREQFEHVFTLFLQSADKINNMFNQMVKNFLKDENTNKI